MAITIPNSEVIHFHASDDRFCGSKQQFRRFTLDPNEVTCRHCMKRDTFVLSPSGEKFLADLGFGADIEAGRA